MNDSMLDRLAAAQSKIDQVKRWWTEDLSRLRELEDAARAVTYYDYSDDDLEVREAVEALRKLVS